MTKKKQFIFLAAFLLIAIPVLIFTVKYSYHLGSSLRLSSQHLYPLAKAYQDTTFITMMGMLFTVPMQMAQLIN